MPLSTPYNPLPMIGKGVAWTAVPVPLKAILSDQSTADGIDSLLIALLITEEPPRDLGLSQAGLTGHEQQDVIRNSHDK
jgi:hypothetical protein